MTTFTITPDTPFSLDAAASFGFGPNTGQPVPAAGQMRLAFVTDDLAGQAGVALTQQGDGTLTASVLGDGDPAEVKRQVSRILSLDHPGAGWLAVGDRDPVIGELQRAHAGLRPVLFHSPYEAAAWSIISVRRHRSQAAAIRTRLSQAFGRKFVIDGERLDAFPTPQRLLAVQEFPGLDPTRIARLHGVARAALDGTLDPGRLAALDVEDALTQVQTIPGIGPMYATLIVVRSTGVTDALTSSEPRLASYAAELYGKGPGPLTPGELAKLAEGWRPYRTWAVVLIRAAGDRRTQIGS
jgi:DNA-3-methyladenine glycosylase II